MYTAWFFFISITLSYFSVEGDGHKFNEPFKKKVPKGAEACNILVGQASFVPEEKKIVAFVRLHEPITGADVDPADS